MRQGLNPSAFLALSGCPVLIESLYECIYISIYTQTWRFSLPKNFRSCSCTTCIVYVNLFKDLFFNVPAGLNRKADAKVRSFLYILQIFPEVFFDDLFWKGLRKIASRTPLSPSCHSGAASFPKAGAKVAGLRITAKYIRNFFHTFLKVFPKWLVIRYVLQHVFFTGYIWEVGYTPYYIY